MSGQAADIARRELADVIADPRWAQWAAGLAATVAIEATLAWLDAGNPDPDTAAVRIGHAVDAVIQAANIVD